MIDSHTMRLTMSRGGRTSWSGAIGVEHDWSMGQLSRVELISGQVCRNVVVDIGRSSTCEKEIS